ncbi:MAG: DNA repair protein RecN [Clostridia bacterium]|nr:DNA repair protein RecN [Clostridia bacterium]MBP3560419.1 DNA repair protein RecN [Clostridia bacterium]
MLSVLKIENIAIIESAEIEFSKGFNVLSGETGAGKSIILDSINAVLGFRTSRELIRTGANEARVTALFSCIDKKVEGKLSELSLPLSPDGTLLISRTISPDKNVCKVNNALTNVSALREIGAELISIHGQQDNRELLNSETHIGYIDVIGGLQKYVTEYRQAYEKLIEIKSQIKRLSGDKEEKARRIDILSYQIDEIEKADINPGEWDKLKDRRNELFNFEKIQGSLSSAYSALNGGDSFTGAVELLSGAFRELSSVSSFSEDLDKLASKLGDLYYEATDISDSIRDAVSDDGFSQAELENIENRLDLLYKLSKKYGATEEEILLFAEKAQKELNKISFSDEKLEELKEEYSTLLEKTKKFALKLSEERKKTSIDFSNKVCNELQYLDMPNVEFLVDFKEVSLYENGIDEAEFLISANVGEIPKPITKIASGGELSRIMLALKTVMANKDNIETMIFDEIDSGVSGRAALKVANKLKQVSNGKQVLCVTHLSQLMSYADTHYLIQKAVRDGKTYTGVTVLDSEGRKREIARIISGGEVTQAQLENAEEMLKTGGVL